jgi:hypothetical protein
MQKVQRNLSLVLTYTYKTYIDDIKITKEQCDALKTELHAIGGTNFMRKYLQDKTSFSIKEILFAFGYILVPILREEVTEVSLIILNSPLKRLFQLKTQLTPVGYLV